MADGEKWTRMSSKDIEAVKNQRKLSQFFGSKSPYRSDRRRCRPKKVEAVIEGDGCVPSISAASIIAKVHRDRLMERIDKDYPLYGFNKHKAAMHPMHPPLHPPLPMHLCIYGLYAVYIYIFIYTHINNILYASRLTVDFQGNHTAAAVFSALWFHVWLQMLPVVPTVKASALSQNVQRIIYVVKQLHAKQLHKHATRKATWL